MKSDEYRDSVQPTMSGIFLLRLWHWVTVASLFLSIDATGLPTMSLRPRTTVLDPEMDTPVDCNSRRTAEGVHGAKRGSDAREDKWPMLYAWNLK